VILRACVLTPSVAFLVVLTAVAAADFPDYPLRAPAECVVNATKDEISIGAQPVEATKDQKTYFNTNLSHLGFVPVFVVIHNGSSEATLLFDKSAVSYESASVLDTPKAKSKTGEVLGLAVIPYAGIFAAAKVMKGVSQIQQNLLKKELRSTTLSPGVSTYGFLYIPPVQNDGSIEGLRLRVPLTKSGADQPTVLELDF
jgi:hypothetical protein